MTRTILKAAVWMSCAAAWAQTGLVAPRAGFVLDARGEVRPAMGMAGNFWLGAGVTSGTAASFGALGGFVQDAGGVSVLDADGRVVKRIAARGEMKFGFAPNGAPALVYFAGAHEIGRVAAPRLVRVRVEADLAALAEADAATAWAVERGDGGLSRVKIALTTGAEVSREALVGVAEPVLILSDGTVVFERERNIVLRDTSGAERQIAATFDAASFTSLGDEWIAGSDKDGTRFAIRTAVGREGAWQLPEEAR
jgi:hypothetical protein